MSEPALDSEPADIHAPEPQRRLAALMDRYERPLYNYLLVLLAHSDAAQDCTQDAFLRAYQNLCRGRPVNARWLYTVARNRAMDHFREQKKLPTEAIEEHPTLETQQPNFESAQAVRHALAQLSPSDREILYLAHADGFRAQEIGEMLGLRVSAVRMRLLRAHQRFRAVYQGDL